MQKSGQITVFLSLTLLCICGLLCGLLESARTVGANYYLKIAADSAMDSVFAGYHRKVWEVYRIFLLEYDVPDEICKDWEGFLEPYEENHGWYPFKPEETKITSLLNITDDHGNYLKQEILDYMQYGVWNLDMDEKHAENLLHNLKEAKSVKQIAAAYKGHTKEAIKLEKSIEAIGKSLEKQRNYEEKSYEGLQRGDGSDFRALAGKMKQEMRRIPGLVRNYETLADQLADHLQETKKNTAGMNGDLDENLYTAMEEELSCYEDYVRRDGTRRLEIETLVTKAERNLPVLEHAVERSDEVEAEISAWSGAEEEERPDEDALWNSVREIYEGIEVPKLSFTAGIKDKKKQNLLEKVEKLVDVDLLNLVLSEGEDVSKGIFDQTDFPSLTHMGEGGKGESAGLLDRLLMDEYCSLFLTNFVSEEKKEVKYEQEYLIGGESTDEANLKQAALEILMIREGLNLIHILSDNEKREEARILAGVITGAVGAAPIIGLVTFFIIGVWALGEAIGDVKTLLAGDDAALFKTRETWNLSLDQLLMIGEKGSTGNSISTEGLNYTEYLKLLLFLEDSESLHYRLMDVIQANIKRGQPDFSMEHCAFGVGLEARAKGKHIFALGDSYYYMRVGTEKAY